MSVFVVNIVRDKGTCVGSITIRRMIHLPACLYAGLSRRYFRIDLDGAVRISGVFGGPDGRTKLCRVCEPWTLIRPSHYPARPADCICPHWRALYSCPVHGAAIRALEDERLNHIIELARQDVFGSDC